MNPRHAVPAALALMAGVGLGLLVARRPRGESEGRTQARRLARRAMREETEMRRRMAEAIHDGPVQELIGLDMVLAAAARAASSGDAKRSAELVTEARELAARNVRSLRDEIVELGPYAFEEVSFESAVERCLDVWKRRYGLDVLLTLERIDLPAEMAGDLFRITQEAVVNAGRHSEAEIVSLSMREVDGVLELRVMDDGKGFGDVDPLAYAEPGHIGLASIRERTELLGGDLQIETSERGSKLVVRAPLRAASGG